MRFVSSAIALAVVAGAIAAAQSQSPQGGKSAQASPPAGAKALFYHEMKISDSNHVPVKPTSPPASALTSSSAATTRPKPRPVDVAAAAPTDPSVGIHYWIELEGTGPVTADRSFKTGDRIKVHVRSNVDGYLALWALDPTGQGSLLFPTGGTEASTPVKAALEYATPGFIKFQVPAQEERLLVFFSRKKTDLPSPSGTPAIPTESEAVSRTLGPTGARSLVFETEQKDPSEVGSYVVNRNGGPIVKEVRLRHQR